MTYTPRPPQVRAPQSSVTPPFKKRRPFHKTWASDTCADFNAKGACVFSERCKFRHMCAECGGGVATVLRPTKS